MGKHWKDVIPFCDAVLRRDEKNARACFRRGVARLELLELEGAVEDLRCAAAANPTDVTVRKEFERADSLLKEHRAEEKKKYGGFIEKDQAREKKKQQAEEARLKAEEEKKAKEEADRAAAELAMRRKCESLKAERGAADFKAESEEVQKG